MPIKMLSKMGTEERGGVAALHGAAIRGGDPGHHLRVTRVKREAKREQNVRKT